MAEYAIDLQQHTLVCTYPTATGSRATTVATIPVGCPEDNADAVAQAVTDLSQALWNGYDDATAPIDPAALAFIRTTITTPGAPLPRLRDIHSWGAALDARHLGEALHNVGDAAFTEAIAAEISQETAAISSAECGVLTGRAAQALVRSRRSPIPCQVEAAEALLAGMPFGDPRLRREIDPASAAVAAIPYLVASVLETARATGRTEHRVLTEIDEVDSYNPDPTLAVLVMEGLGNGGRPEHIVSELLNDCARASSGLLPNVERTMARIAAAEAAAEIYAPGEQRFRYEFLATADLTPLEMRRPAPSLLSGVLAAIDGCFQLWKHGADGTAVGNDGPDAPTRQETVAAQRQEFWTRVRDLLPEIASTASRPGA